MTILEISSENKHLALDRGFFVIKESGAEVGKVALDMIDAVIVSGYMITYSHNILAKCCELGIPVIISGANFHPIGILLPTIGNYKQQDKMQAQIEITKPFNKNLWKTIVQHKIKNQAKLLQDLGLYAEDLVGLAKGVLSGDSENAEAVSARLYFPRLFDEKFIRNDDENPINHFLNYGYAIIRACIARYIVASGLNPAFGIHHHNKLNPFCLVDDMIEPFRPFVDRQVYRMFEKERPTELLPKHKKILSSLLNNEFKTQTGSTKLKTMIEKSVFSLVKSYENKKDSLVFFVLSDILEETGDDNEE